MLLRKSTLSFVTIAALIFIAGSSLVAWMRPEYVPRAIPTKWRDWTGLGSDDSDFPLPIPITEEDNDKSKHAPRPGDKDTVHILPFHDDEHEVKPLPISPSTQMTEIEINSNELRKRLYALLSAPVLSFPETVETFAKTCPRKIADKQVNPSQFSSHMEMWSTIDNDDLVRKRYDIVKYLEKVEARGDPVVWDGRGRGKGIVMTGGNQVSLISETLYKGEETNCVLSAFHEGHSSSVAGHLTHSSKAVQNKAASGDILIPR